MIRLSMVNKQKNRGVLSHYLPAMLFFVTGLIALQVPFSRLLGANVRFTLFDFFAPTAGVFLGTAAGILVVLLAQLVNLLLHGGVSDIGAFVRLIPTLFAVWYFAKKRRSNLFIAAAAIVAFNLHPIGRSAWQYSLFWLIPIAAHVYRDNLFIRSLGATFTAHAVGGALWVWMFGLSKEMWLTLIPQVALERSAMAGGIALSYAAILALQKYLLPSKFGAKKYTPRQIV